jgi:hypothetical protein
VITNVTVDDVEAAEALLRDEVIPQVSQAPGFVAGYWTRKDNTGLGMVVFESEEAAQAAADRVQSQTGSGVVTMDSVEVREVVGHA